MVHSSRASHRHQVARNLVARTLLLLVSCCAVPAYSLPIHTDYAVLFAGGGYADINYSYYHDATMRMWGITTQTLGFDVKNVYVLAADGTSTYGDQCTAGFTDAGGNWVCTAHDTSDWSAITNAGGNILDGSRNSLFDTMMYLSSVMRPDDSFYFWSFDHGYNEQSPPTGSDVGLVAWGSPWIRDDEFASWVDFLDVKAEIFAFGECYAGGMVDDLDLAHHSNRFAAWAASGCESSYGSGWVDAWADGIQNKGLRWAHDLGVYAQNNDIYGPAYKGLEHPGYSGANIHIVSNEIPEPSTLLLVAIGGMVGYGLTTRLKASGRT